MSTSPTIRPIRPSMGTTPRHRTCPGSKASNAGTKTRNQQPPKALARGDCTLRERNHRAPISEATIGSRNAPIPKPCSRMSEKNAPTMPTQLRAEREPVSTEALFREGSSGEYETSARKRRSAETHNKNPTSSLSRRLLLGLRTRDKNFMKAYVASLPGTNYSSTFNAVYARANRL